MLMNFYITLMHVLSFGLSFGMYVLFWVIALRVVLRLASQLKGATDQGLLDELVVISDFSTFKTL